MPNENIPKWIALGLVGAAVSYVLWKMVSGKKELKEKKKPVEMKKEGE